MTSSAKYSVNLMRSWSIESDRITCILNGSFVCWCNSHRRHPMTKVFFSFLNVSSPQDKKIPLVDDEEISINEFGIFFFLLCSSDHQVATRERKRDRETNSSESPKICFSCQGRYADCQQCRRQRSSYLRDLSVAPIFCVFYSKRKQKPRDVSRSFSGG
jgi:hypothetical protein